MTIINYERVLCAPQHSAIVSTNLIWPWNKRLSKPFTWPWNHGLHHLVTRPHKNKYEKIEKDCGRFPQNCANDFADCRLLENCLTFEVPGPSSVVGKSHHYISQRIAKLEAPLAWHKGFCILCLEHFPLV